MSLPASGSIGNTAYHPRLRLPLILALLVFLSANLVSQDMDWYLRKKKRSHVISGGTSLTCSNSTSHPADDGGGDVGVIQDNTCTTGTGSLQTVTLHVYLTALSTAIHIQLGLYSDK